MARVLLYCLDVVGKSMAGPAVRYWEMAKALSSTHEVILRTPNVPDVEPQGFSFLQGEELPLGIDVVVTQEITHALALQARKKNIKLILDAYDPQPLEFLEIFKLSDKAIRNHKQNQITNTINFSFHMADAVICASEKQKDLWMGLMMGQKKITPALYDQDPSLHHFIGLVPFGLNEAPPVKTGPGLREKFNISKNDTVLLWGGGIWNWFDPLTLIEAMHEISFTRKDIKLVFLGVKHPNDAVPEMKMAADAIKQAKKYHLFEEQIFFNFEWTPYNERQNFLLEADIGVSTHFEHLETQYAFRTRMLDYIWTGLPIIATQGDSFAALIEKENLGKTVPQRNSKALAEAILAIADDANLRNTIKSNHERIRSQFYWSVVVKPLQHIITRLEAKNASTFSFAHIRQLVAYYMTNKSPFALLKKVVLRLALTTRT